MSGSRKYTPTLNDGTVRMTTDPTPIIDADILKPEPGHVGPSVSTVPVGLDHVWHSGMGPRPAWLSFFCGWRATGIDFQPNVSLWGMGLGRRFIGMTVVDKSK